MFEDRINDRNDIVARQGLVNARLRGVVRAADDLAHAIREFLNGTGTREEVLTCLAAHERSKVT